jgi:S-adenosylmethionine decarboxylase
MKAEIVHKSIWVKCDDEQKISIIVESILKKSDFTILGTIEHYFEPVGYTKLWLLAESHCAMHTFPEETKTYIELSSCSISKFNIFWDSFIFDGECLKIIGI